MQDNKNKLDFPNPLKHLEVEDKPVKLKELSDCIKRGRLTVVACDSVIDFKMLIKRIPLTEEYLLLNGWVLGYGMLKRIAQKKNKAIIVRIGVKKARKLQKRNRLAKYIKLNHKPYYYVVGCKNKHNSFDIGWTVIGANIVE